MFTFLSVTNTLHQGESTETEAELSTDTSTDLSVSYVDGGDEFGSCQDVSHSKNVDKVLETLILYTFRVNRKKCIY